MANRDAEKTPSETSSSLLARAKTEDPEAWSRLVLLYAPIIYRWCRRWGLEPAAAEKVGETVLKQVYENLSLSEEQSPQKTFRDWLFELTRGQVQSRLSEDLVSAKLEPNNEVKTIQCQSDEQSRDALNEEQKFLFSRAFEIIKGNFTDEELYAFQNILIEGTSIEKVAERLGWQIDAVYITHSKILRTLRQEFDGLLDF